jgi:nucleotide sugar dehydrogenase
VNATATVVGLGKIGLPLAVRIAESGWRVHGADIDAGVVDAVNGGRPPSPGEHGLAERLQRVITSGALVATTDTADAVARSSAVVIVVPLVVDSADEPDFGALDAATAAVGAALRAGTLVSFETTLPVGTTRNRLGPMLEQAAGLRIGSDLFVCYSPERVSSGSVFADLRRYPKLVGGLDGPSTSSAIGFYESVLEFEQRPDLPRPNGVWDLGSAEAAELVKLAETTYRDLNIAFANELAVAADEIGVDVMDVITASNSQPYSHIHVPGIAVGGHCIPVYPYLLMGSTSASRLAAVARTINDGMPRYAVELIERHTKELAEATVVVLGVSYRGDVKETFRSGVWSLVALLEERGARVLVQDPLFSDAELRAFGLTPYRLGEPCDVVVIQAGHEAYRELDASAFPGVRILVDGRRVTRPSGWEGVVRVVIGGGA